MTDLLSPQKADKLALDSKVSRLQFDAATEQLTSMFHELLNKMTGQEHDWHQLVDKLSTDMECKVPVLARNPARFWSDAEVLIRVCAAEPNGVGLGEAAAGGALAQHPEEAADAERAAGGRRRRHQEVSPAGSGSGPKFRSL